jgi:hypothetical protein
VPAYAHLPVLLFTGVALAPEQEAVVADLRAKVFYKPQPYAELIDELHRQLTPVNAGERQAGSSGLHAGR